MSRPVIVAIPARDEAERIVACLAALATQRDGCGAPLPTGSFSVLVLANNCTDGTAAVVERFAAVCPHPVTVVAARLSGPDATAGGARKRAMDLAAERLAQDGHVDGVILTTDADSVVAPTWIAGILAGFARGAQGVAGYIDAHPAEIVGLGAAFLARGRLEDVYLRAVAEIYARCDPQPHDPWPNHRVSSGASLGVTLTAYRRIGGLPALPVGEDAALTRALERAGLAVCHPMDVTVSTSCRLNGRAPGGAADTMRLRQQDPEAPCDEEIEPALMVLRRAAWQGRLRRAQARGIPLGPRWTALGLPRAMVVAFSDRLAREPVRPVFEAIEAASPMLRRGPPLRPADLPAETLRAEALLHRLRRLAPGRTLAPQRHAAHNPNDAIIVPVLLRSPQDAIPGDRPEISA